MLVLEVLWQLTRNLSSFSKIKLPNLLDIFNKKIIFPLQKNNSRFSCSLGKVWEKEIGILNTEEWETLFMDRQKLDKVLEELLTLEEIKYVEVGNKNEEAFNTLAKKVYNTVLALINKGEKPPFGWNELKGLIEREDFGNESYEAVRTVLSPFRYDDLLENNSLGGIHDRPEMKALYSEWRGLKKFGQDNLKQVENEIQARYAHAEEERREVALSYNKALGRLAVQTPKLLQELFKFLDEIKINLCQKLPTVNFFPYSSLITDSKINPFSGKGQADIPTLIGQLHRPLMREKIETDLGISLSEINLNSQVHMLQFLASNNKGIFNQIRGVLQEDITYKREFLISFLSCAGDFRFGDKLMEISKKYFPEVAGRIFTKYAELVDASDRAREYLETNFGEKLAAKPGLEDEIVQNLLRKGKSILKKAAEEETSEEVFLKELEHCKGDLLLFANAFRGVYGKEVSLEQFHELGFEHVPGGELTQETQDQMLAIADRNWSELRILMPGMHDQIMHDIPAQLKGKDPKTGEIVDTIWHVMKRGDTVLGFFRLDNFGQDSVYFGSMNSLPDLHGFKLGDAILKEMLIKETKGKLTEAHASPKTAICRSYLYRYGFVGTDLLSYYDTGEQLLAIEKDTREGRQPNYLLQGKSYSELEFIKGNTEEGIEIIGYQFSEDFSEEEYRRFLKDAQQHFDHNFVLTAYVAGTTQYIFDPVTNKKTIKYLVGFEPKQKSPYG
jgi:hypothetical protein